MIVKSLSQLHEAVGELLNADSNDLSFERIAESLSHNCFLYHCKEAKYFVKAYTFSPNQVKRVAQINRTTEFMRLQGIPAPELVAYSEHFANVVIHRFIDANKIDWSFELLAPLAALYSRIVSIGKNQRLAERQIYLEDLQRVRNEFLLQINKKIGRSPELSELALKLCQRVLREVSKLDSSAEFLVLNLHDEFTEKNLLARDNRISLICDWDSYRPAVFWENLASSASRFSTLAPLSGRLDRQRLANFLQSLSPQIIQRIGDIQTFARLFTHLGILRHLRTYSFRNQLIATRKPELEQSLLVDPLKHCEWMTDRSDEVASWILEDLAALAN